MTIDFDHPVRQRVARARSASACAMAFALVLALHASDALAQKLTPLPSLAQRVNDNVGMLNDEDESELTALLARYRTEKGVEVLLLTIASTGSETIDEYASRLLRSWMAAHEGFSDVVFIVVARDNRPDSNRVVIAAGPKAALSETDARRIVEEDILPHFRVLEYGPGLIAGVDRVKAVLGGQPLPPIVQAAAPRTSSRRPVVVLAAVAAAGLAIVALFVFAVRHAGSRRMVHLTGRRPLNRSFEPMLAGRIVGRRRPTADDDGGNGFGGGFGVMRGPIGAGDFSGGGASGSW